MKALTETQSMVLEHMRTHCRNKVVRYKDKHSHLYKDNLGRISRGDQASVFGLGVLTWQLGKQLGMPASKVLRIFRALEAKGLVLPEEKRDYQHPLYWWPVGLAAELAAELASH